MCGGNGDENMMLKMGVIVIGLGLTVKAMMEGDRWDNMKVQYVALFGYALFWFGIGLLF